MGRRYAGVLGALAFATTLLHGIVHAGGVEATVGQATACLALFAVVGFVVGHIAEQTIDESVRASVAEKLAEHKRNEELQATS